MIALSTLALAGPGVTMRPPSIAAHTLCTRILPVARSSEISTTPAPSEPERSVIEMPSARPSGRFAFQSHICATVSNTLRAFGVIAHALEAELDRVHALVRRHLVDQALDRERVEHVADRAPVLELDAVRDAAPLDVLVGHVVVGNLDAGDQQEPAVADDAVLPAGHLAARVGRRLQALERLRAEHALGDVLLARPDQLDRPAHLLGDQRALGRIVAERAPAEAAAHVALVEVDLLGLEAERLGHRLARFVGRLAAFPHLGLVAGVVDAHHRVQRLHLRVIAVVAAELGLVGLGRARERRLHVALLLELDRLRVRIVVDANIVRRARGRS